MTELMPKSFEAENGKIVLTLISSEGDEFRVILSAFNVSTVVSGLYAARAEALKQPADTSPEVILPLQKLAFFSDTSGNDAHQILRVYVTETLFQDFSPSEGSGLHEDLFFLGQVLATKSGTSSGPSGNRH